MLLFIRPSVFFPNREKQKEPNNIRLISTLKQVRWPPIMQIKSAEKWIWKVEGVELLCRKFPGKNIATT